MEKIMEATKTRRSNAKISDIFYDTNNGRYIVFNNSERDWRYQSRSYKNLKDAIRWLKLNGFKYFEEYSEV